MQDGIGNMRWCFVLVVTLSSIVIPTWKIFAQDNYRTLRGTIVLSTEVNNEPVTFVSSELDVQLNYETAEIRFTLKKNSIRTNNIVELQHFIPEQVQFYGKLGIEYIKTDSHPNQIFGIEGRLSTESGQELEIHATGGLSHLYSNASIACLLNISMQLDQQYVEGFILDRRPTGDMLIEITNTVLAVN